MGQALNPVRYGMAGLVQEIYSDPFPTRVAIKSLTANGAGFNLSNPHKSGARVVIAKFWEMRVLDVYEQDLILGNAGYGRC